MNGQFKDLRKAAFAVGFGVAMGKFAAEMTQAVITGIELGALKIAAKEGNEIAQEVCEKAKVDVEPKDEEVESKIKMGFQCK